MLVDVRNGEYNNIRKESGTGITSLKSLRLRDLLTFGYLWLPYWALLGLTRPYSALLGLTQPYSALLGLTGPYWALLGLTGPYLALLSLI